jgi:hypothetical protein
MTLSDVIVFLTSASTLESLAQFEHFTIAAGSLLATAAFVVKMVKDAWKDK